MTLRFTVPGEPVPWGRSGLRVVAGHAQSYTPAKTRSHEAWVRLHALTAIGIRAGFPMDGPVSVSVVFFLRRPPSRRKQDTLPDRKPDLDNLLKSTLDGLALAGVFTNDSRIVRIEAVKAYGDPRTEIEVVAVDSGGGGGWVECGEMAFPAAGRFRLQAGPPPDFKRE